MARFRPKTTKAGTALGLLLSLVAVSFSEARGGCVFPHALAGPAERNHFEMLAGTGALGAIPAAPEPSRNPLSPCAGLRCSGDPVPLPSSAPSPTTQRVETWGKLSAPPPVLDRSAATLPLDESVSHGEDHDRSPFRPPR